MDAVMFTIMDDPVMLPTSKNIMDRGCIVRQLLTKEEDPFNRAPLKVSDLIPLPDLKQRIDEYRAQKVAEAREKKSKKESDRMETDSQVEESKN